VRKLSSLRNRFLHLLLAIAMLAVAANASDTTAFYSGSLSSPTDTFTLSVNLATAGTVSVQTYGFGGGVNAEGNTVAPGGFDPLVALFDSSGNIIDGTSDVLVNYYANPSYQGCPPAGLVQIGTGAGSMVCGDVFLSFSLAAGDYTLLLSDADYIPDALVDPGSTNLADGFTDFTGGVFQTCNVPASGDFACITPSADYAFDLTVPATPVPEPATFTLLASALGAGWLGRKRRRH